ncbi:hypothetical protein LTR85_007653 [Meristemomyces frigidus]|nr:hypothetical protein LTR85_007653 [Meristemomyces frigidus]
MLLLTALSGTLFVLPVLVTFGIYFGLDHQRILECGFHCGSDNSNSSTGSGNSSTGTGTSGDLPTGANLTAAQYCEKSYAITPAPGRYTFNPNQWGDTNDTGSLCINVSIGTGFTNSGSDNQDYAAGFAATWQYPQGSEDSPVHAFPNADLNLPSVFPVQLSTLSGLDLDVSWAYDPDSTIVDSTNYTGLVAAEVNANVCVDMFLSSNISDANSTTGADFEVMVWLGRFGAATDPIGVADGPQENRTVNGTTFSLYYGDNSLGQHTITWLADQNTTDFTGNLGPLLRNLSSYTGPTSDDYLGYVAFGSEALYSNRNVTFYVPKLAIEVSVS